MAEDARNIDGNLQNEFKVRRMICSIINDLILTYRDDSGSKALQQVFPAIRASAFSRYIIDKADVPATKLPVPYRISTLSFPLDSCRSRYNVSRIFLKGLFFCIQERQLWSGNEDGEIRYVSDNSVAGTSALSPGVPRHMKKLHT